MVSRHFRPEVRVFSGFGARVGGCGGARSLVSEGRFLLGSGGRRPGPRVDAGLSPPPALAKPRYGGRPVLAARDFSDGSPPSNGDLDRGGRGNWTDAGPPSLRVFSENEESPAPGGWGKKACDDGCLLLLVMRAFGTSAVWAIQVRFRNTGVCCEILISLLPGPRGLRCHCWF